MRVRPAGRDARAPGNGARRSGSGEAGRSAGCLLAGRARRDGGTRARGGGLERVARGLAGKCRHRRQRRGPGALGERAGGIGGRRVPVARGVAVMQATCGARLAERHLQPVGRRGRHEPRRHQRPQREQRQQQPGEVPRRSCTRGGAEPLHGRSLSDVPERAQAATRTGRCGRSTGGGGRARTGRTAPIAVRGATPSNGRPARRGTPRHRRHAASRMSRACPPPRRCPPQP